MYLPSYASKERVLVLQAACDADPIGERIPAFLAGLLEKRRWTEDLVPKEIHHLCSPGAVHVVHVPRSCCAAERRPVYLYDMLERMMPPKVAIFSRGSGCTEEGYIDSQLDRFFKPVAPPLGECNGPSEPTFVKNKKKGKKN